MRTARFVVAGALALVAAACGGKPKDTVRLRHEAKRALVYELDQHEEAPNTVVGLGGSLDVGETVKLACIAVMPDGVGHYEVTVEQVRLRAPEGTGVAVDTKAGKPVPGDTIGANAFVLSMLPRTAIVQIAADSSVHGVQPDQEVRDAVTRWIQGKDVKVRKALFRIGEALDAGPVAGRWFQPLTGILPSGPVAPGDTWTATPPDVDTPAGMLRATIPTSYRREGDVAVLEGAGAFAVVGAPSAKRTVDFEKGTIRMTARIDLARGVLVSYDEAGEFSFRMREADRPLAAWKHTRKLRLVE